MIKAVKCRVWFGTLNGFTRVWKFFFVRGLGKGVFDRGLIRSRREF